MSHKKVRDFECEVVHEPVQIYLRDKRNVGLESHRAYFVQCNQGDCQYVEENKPPCPLNLAMFTEELKEREEKARRRRESI